MKAEEPERDRIIETVPPIEPRPVVPTVPLREAVLCVECDSIYRTGREACPRCGSAVPFPVARIVRPRESTFGSPPLSRRPTRHVHRWSLPDGRLAVVAWSARERRWVIVVGGVGEADADAADACAADACASEIARLLGLVPPPGEE